MMKRDLFIDLNNPKETISIDMQDGSEEYEKGYVPYSIRRRMDLHEGEKNEIVNDLAVNLECARLRTYGNRRYASRAHIHDLLAYTFGKGTLITPEKIADPEKVVREGDVYNQARMGWECVKYYIHNILMERVIWKINDTEKTKKNIHGFIYWNDLENFILAALKLKHDPEVAETFAYLPHQEILDYLKLLPESYRERMVTYIFVGSRYGELSRLDEKTKVLSCLHRVFGNYISRLAMGFTPQEAGLIDTRMLDSAYIEARGYQMILHGHQVLTLPDGKLRYRELADACGFLMRLSKEVPVAASGNVLADKEVRRQIFAGMIASQDGLRENWFKNLPKEKPATLEQAEKMVKEGSRNRFITFGLWMQFQAEEELYPFVKPEWVQEKNYWFLRALCTAMTRDFFEPWNFSNDTASVEWLYRVFKQLTEILIVQVDRRSVDEPLEKTMERVITFQPFICLAKRMKEAPSKNAFIQTFNESIYKFLRHPRLREFGVKLLLESGYQNLTNNDLEFLMEHDVSVTDVLRISSIDKNLAFLQSHQGKEFIELPMESITPWKQERIPEKSMKWLATVLTDEQMKTYPFSAPTMRAYPEIFEKFIDERNIDRYIYAYGLNWVEEHHKVSISDLVNSGSFVNRTVIRRYLDIILMDFELREKALANRNVTDAICNPKTLRFVLTSNNFTNDIKCEVLVRCMLTPQQQEKLSFWMKDLVEDYTLDILSGGKMNARALLLNLANHDIHTYDEYLQSPLLDMEPDTDDE